MTSILTNIAATAALSTLRGISSGMEETQARVSSGLKVGEAADNAAYWSIATTMRSDNMALSAVSDALGLGAAKVDTAYSGMESAIEVVKEIKAKLVAATEDGVDKNKIQEELSQLQDQLVSISEAASFSGENWLQADLTASGGSETKSVVASFVRDGTGAVSVKKVDYTLDATSVLFDTTGDTGILDAMNTVSGAAITINVNVGGVVDAETVRAFTTDDVIASGAGTTVFDGSYANDGTNDYVKVADDTWVIAVDQTGVPEQEVAFTDSAAGLWAIDLTQIPVNTTTSVSTLSIDSLTTGAALDGMIQMVDDALELMTSAAAEMGSLGMRIDMQTEFVNNLSDSIESGVGRLVDADMNEESTRLKALQTQQQLAIQSLSIANSSTESILTLFR
jgi:flagellin